ncbi:MULTISPECIES: DUF4235 domain-containing protein [Arthrobacter]|uniref:DUF4235 domain-containing protein n=1 Tax=Arthrobacter terricola TaxID=2547396 RepID=A0A4R5KIM9_9MICC|nr:MULTISPECIES: DUF4235 domain-containing protein [Arthrobacter]MBT8161991.1 DUF4235 domain-containing protein [Arthrobacter sp. GN70]TDF94615.1 DUF4235 domain-containing protein [Arthrobacter terricola]
MNMLIKLMGTAISIVAGLVGTKIVNTVWEKTTGNKPPTDKDETPQSLRSALTFALISSTVSTIIQVLANRGTQRAIVRFQKTQDIV